MTSETLPQRTGAACVLGEAACLVRELRDVLWAARGVGEKADTIVAIEELKSVLDAIELEVVRDLEASRGLRALGWASTQDFVTTVAGGHRGQGSSTVRLAEAMARPVMAPVAEAHRDGWLSTVKAHVIDRAIEQLPSRPDVRERGVRVLLEEAGRLDATDLRRAARRLAEVVDPDGTERRAERELEREERAAHLGRYLVVRGDGAGGAVLRGRCSTEDAALIRSTLLPLSRPTPATGTTCDPTTCAQPGCSHDGRDPRDHGARSLDALVHLCRFGQTASLAPDCHGAPTRLVVTMGLDGLRSGIRLGTTETGEDLPAAVVRRLACDAELVPAVLGGPSAVLDVGRQQRLVTAAIWRALAVRDEHCRFPGCTRPPLMCHAHHVRHWVDGGPTSLDNLILLCGHHHRLVHAGPWTISRSGEGEFRFEPPDHLVRRHPGRAPPTVTA